MAAAVAKFRVVVKDGMHAKVRPASDFSDKANGKVVFKNNTSDDVVFYLPGNVFTTGLATDPLQANPFTITMASTDPPRTMFVHPTGQAGLFNFRAWCEQTKSFADGNSDPEFIIEN